MLFTKIIFVPFHRKGSSKRLGDEAQIESLFVGVARHSPEAFCKGFRIAVLAAGRNLGAAPDWVPRGIRPFDIAVLAHSPTSDA